MGWLSGADTLSQVWTHINVETKEGAIAIAERNGWPYEVVEAPNNKMPVVKSYSYNFLTEVCGPALAGVFRSGFVGP